MVLGLKKSKTGKNIDLKILNQWCDFVIYMTDQLATGVFRKQLLF